MKTVAFASGKGGAGKTSLSMSFYYYLREQSVFADCDVDASDAFLMIEKETMIRESFESGYKYAIDAGRCSACGACAPACAFDAIRSGNHDYAIDTLSCEGCGACEDVCPDGAIFRRTNRCGELLVSRSVYDTPLVYARLKPGEDNSGKLVHKVRQTAADEAIRNQKLLIVIDAPPGIGCPVIAALTGVNLLVLVIECTRSGFHDACRLIHVADQLQLSKIAVINKSGVHPELERQITDYLNEQNIPLAGVIPFSKTFSDALNKKNLIIRSNDAGLTKNLTGIFQIIHETLEGKKYVPA